MPKIVGPVAGFIAEHHGMIDRCSLHEFGVSDTGIDRLVTGGQLLRIHRGVYASSSHRLTFESRLVGACMAHPRVVGSHLAAGRQWGLRRMGRPLIQVSVPNGCRPQLAGVKVYRTRHLEASDIVVRDDGIRLTSPPRTVFDLAAVLDDFALESVIEQAIDQYCTFRSLELVASRLGTSGRAGAARFVRVLKSRPIDRGASDSEAELLLARALSAVGLKCEPQHRLRLDRGVVIHVDLALVEQRIAIEVDHGHWHGTAAAIHRDKERDRLLSRAGWRPVRVTDIDVERRLSVVVDDIVAIARLG